MRSDGTKVRPRWAALLVALGLALGIVFAPAFTQSAAATEVIYSPGDGGQYTVNGQTDR